MSANRTSLTRVVRPFVREANEKRAENWPIFHGLFTMYSFSASRSTKKKGCSLSDRVKAKGLNKLKSLLYFHFRYFSTTTILFFFLLIFYKQSLYILCLIVLHKGLFPAYANLIHFLLTQTIFFLINYHFHKKINHK